MPRPSIRRAPPLTLLATEPMRAAWEYLSHWTQHQPVRQAAAATHPVVIFPGLASNGLAVGPLRRHCGALGHPAVDWGRGFNTGPSGEVGLWLDELAADTEALLEPIPGRASLIGWSLGGFYAREVAKRIPHRVRQVITIGTPFNGDPSHTNVEWLFKLLNRSTALKDSQLTAQLRTPPPLPCTAVFSRGDGIVDWDGCRHIADGPSYRNVGITGSHLGMGWNPEVLQVVRRQLAEHNDPIRPTGARRTPVLRAA